MKLLLAPMGFDPAKFDWDITLVTGSQYIDSQRQRQDISRGHRLALATKPLPRFYWQASLYYDNKPSMTILFDATDLEQGDVVVHVIEENTVFCTAARSLAVDPSIRQARELQPDWRIWNWLCNNPPP